MPTALWVVYNCSLGYLKFSKISIVYMYNWYTPKRVKKKTKQKYDKCYKPSK